jgi:hypothetical protein
MAMVSVDDVTCPACEVLFDCDFDPEQEVNDIDCPECNAPLVVEAYDPKKNVLILAEAEIEGEEADDETTDESDDEEGEDGEE